MSAAPDSLKPFVMALAIAGLCLGTAGAAHGSTAADDAHIAAQLSRLEDGQDSPAARDWLSQLLNYAEQSRRPHPEGRGQTLPRYAIAARAQHLLRKWDQQHRLEQLRQQPALRGKALGQAQNHDALLNWLGEASMPELDAFRAEQGVHSWSEDILAVMIQRQARWTDWLALAERAQHARSWRLINSHAPLDHPQFARLLENLEANPALRGAAPALRARWVQRDPQRLAELAARIDSRNWDLNLIETALLAQPPGLTMALIQGLQHPDQAALAAWALWRLRSPEALNALSAYTRSDAAVPHLAREIAAWLR